MNVGKHGLSHEPAVISPNLGVPARPGLHVLGKEGGENRARWCEGAGDARILSGTRSGIAKRAPRTHHVPGPGVWPMPRHVT